MIQRRLTARISRATALLLLVATALVALGACGPSPTGTTAPAGDRAATAGLATRTRNPSGAQRKASPAVTEAAAANPASLPPGLVLATPGANDRLKTVRYERLPPQAKDTATLIGKGGPFPYRQDGVVFENREGNLPKQPKGYYHEYTVVTPGSADRGARRLIQGSGGELYYTDDHYATFRRVVP